MIEPLEHTADAGFRVRAATLEELFREAALGLQRLIVATPERIEPRQERRLELVAPELETLLFDWLDELLWLFAGERWIWREVGVEALERDGGWRLVAQLRGEPFAPERHPVAAEVKAITYHGFGIRETTSGYEATVIVDI